MGNKARGARPRYFSSVLLPFPSVEMDKATDGNGSKSFSAMADENEF